STRYLDERLDGMAYTIGSYKLACQKDIVELLIQIREMVLDELDGKDNPRTERVVAGLARRVDIPEMNEE
ncbi:hypothetical protein LCGC14_1120100, partial [marine sediment metagenome]